LTVLDYCLHQGSENVVLYFRDNIYVIKTLKEFQYIDEDSKDQGANVRQKAKDITNLLTDEARLREERRTRANMRDRMIRGVNGDDNDNEENENVHRRQDSSAGKGRKRDEDELTRAIEESKKSLAKEHKDREEMELQEALRLSKEEEDKRKKDVDNSNESSLFDDANQLYVFLVDFRYSIHILCRPTVRPQPVLPRTTILSPLSIPLPMLLACSPSLPYSLNSHL
jgi:epsin